MGKETGIAWTDSTFNPWWGCTKVSEGCKNCYAETFAKRFGVQWGEEASRRVFRHGGKHWHDPVSWNANAQDEGVRRRVFCGSMCDVFEDGRREELEPQRRRLFDLIEGTEHLDWLLLTKRPENLADMLPKHWLRSPRSNVWLGTTVENQKAADERIPILVHTPAALRFLSMEPMLEAIQIPTMFCDTEKVLRDSKPWDNLARVPILALGDLVQWIIVGGESGPRARPFHVEWARSIQAQCKAAGVAFFMKQLGAHPVFLDGYDLDDERARIMDAAGMNPLQIDQAARSGLVRMRDRAGADPFEWPTDLRTQEMPAGRKS
jgi:protein gp37